jgi:hypothetical protein
MPAPGRGHRTRGATDGQRGPQAPAHYEVRVAGHLDDHWSTWFGGLTLAHSNDGTTLLRGVVTDQSELYGLLDKVRDLGIALISVTPVDAAHGDSQH